MVVLAIFVAVVYVPDVGRAFIKDDFGWVLSSRVRGVDDIQRLFSETRGFYRPVVSLSFSFNEQLSGRSALGYGLTNLTLAVATAFSIGWFAVAWGVPSGAAFLAGSAWLLNFHGINMAVIWVSGRTALWLTLFAALAAVAAAKGRSLTAAALVLGAMLSKEEAILLPLPIIAIFLLREGGRRQEVLMATVSLTVVLGLYLLLRMHSDAVTPATAPPFYRFVFEPAHIIRNVREYADRGATYAMLIVILLILLVRKAPRLTSNEQRLVLVGVAWFMAGFAITTFLPVRSSLYACFPSIGTALIAAALAAALWRQMSFRLKRTAAYGALILPMILMPIYKQRNQRWVELADLSRAVTPALAVAADLATDGNIVLVDDRSTRVSLSTTYDALIADAVELASDKRRTLWIVPPSPGFLPAETVKVPHSFNSVWRLHGRQLQRIDGSEVIGLPAEVIR